MNGISGSKTGFATSPMDSASTPAKRVAVIDRSKVDPNEVKAAEGLEAMFTDYLMKVMRQTVPKNDMDLESPATEIYRSMQDSEYAERAARQGALGLADQVIAYWESSRYTGMKGPEKVPAENPKK